MLFRVGRVVCVVEEVCWETANDLKEGDGGEDCRTGDVSPYKHVLCFGGETVPLPMVFVTPRGLNKTLSHDDLEKRVK